MKNISCVNGCWRCCTGNFPAYQICSDILPRHHLVISLIQSLYLSSWTCYGWVCLLAFCPNQFSGNRKRPVSAFSFTVIPFSRHQTHIRRMMLWNFETRPSPPPPAVTQNRALSLGTCRQQQADLVTAPAGTSGGQSLEGRQTLSNLTPLDALACLRLTRLLPSQKPVTLLKARPWLEVSINGSLEKEISMMRKEAVLQHKG